MRASLLGIVLSALLACGACGGNVVVDGASTAMGGAAGTGGAGTTTGEGGAGGASCTMLMSAFQVANTAALACDPDGPDVCTALAPDACGCSLPANSTGNLVADDTAAYQALSAAGCAYACFGCPVPGTSTAQCLPASSGYQCALGPG
jgi:hypothetical protein